MITRPQLALAALTLTLAAAIAALVFVVVSNSDSDDEPDPPGLSRDLTAAANVTPLPSSTPIPDPTPLAASKVMFCLPWTMPADPQRFIVAPEGTQPRYRAGTCERLPALAGMIAVTNADGTLGEVPLEQATAGGDVERVVWMPAQALLFGEPTVLTGRFILVATIDDDAFGEPVVVIAFQQEGLDLLSAITRDNVGLPLALFIDGEPVRIDDGTIWYHPITGETVTPIIVQGLTTDADIVLQDQLNALLTDE